MSRLSLSPIQHCVFLKYQSDTNDAHIQAFREKMLALQHSIEEVQHVENGIDELHDERSRDLMLIMQFEPMTALRAY